MRTGTIVTKTALPKTNSSQVQQMANEDPNYLSAYRVCLQYEVELAENENKLRHVRILGFLLLNAPTRGVRFEVTKHIHSCRDRSELVRLGASLELYFILPFRKYRSRTPKSSYHSYSSRPSFEAVENQVQIDITTAPKNHQDAKDHALRRDNWRCVVTGLLHDGAPEDLQYQALELDPLASLSFTDCAHIIPEATFFGPNPNSGEISKLDYSASILAILKRFHYNISNFNGEGVHSLTNVITLDGGLHEVFDQLVFYFESTPEKNRYETRYFTPLRPHPLLPRFVTFSTTDPVHLPVPAPELLALHATCCKVAHLSGAAEYINKVYLDAEKMGVLASDGTSDDILSYMLLSLSDDTLDVRG